METLRLYDNAAEVISEGLGLNLEGILSHGPTPAVVANSKNPVSFDIDERYNSTVKELYGNIVEFISNNQSPMSPSQKDEMFSLRAAGRDIVEAIKDTKHLQKNLSRYLVSDNEFMRKEYDQIRINLADVLRKLDTVRRQGSDSNAILSLDSLKIAMKQYDRDLEIKLNTLIRDRLISAPMSISLMNDSGYAYHVTKNLVKMGEVLFSTGETGLREAEKSVSLDEGELDELMLEVPTSSRRINDENP